jgi:hypothetical protein
MRQRTRLPLLPNEFSRRRPAAQQHQANHRTASIPKPNPQSSRECSRR